MTERAIEVAREGLEEIREYILDSPINNIERYFDTNSALRKLTNFVNMTETEMKGRK